MMNQPNTLTTFRNGWTLIVLLVVVAIIALLMIIYLPRVLQSYSPPTTTDEQGESKPVLQDVKERLDPAIDTHNQQLEDYLNEEQPPQDKQP